VYISYIMNIAKIYKIRMCEGHNTLLNDIDVDIDLNDFLNNASRKVSDKECFTQLISLIPNYFFDSYVTLILDDFHTARKKNDYSDSSWDTKDQPTFYRNQLCTDRIKHSHDYIPLFDDIVYKANVGETNVIFFTKRSNEDNNVLGNYLKFSCKKITYSAPSLFDFNDNKLMLIDSRNCVNEHLKYILVHYFKQYEYISWSLLSEILYYLSIHEDSDSEEHKIFADSINYAKSYEYQHIKLSSFFNSPNTHPIARLTINNDHAEIHLNSMDPYFFENINPYLYVGFRPVYIKSKKKLYLQKNINLLHDINIITFD